MNRKILALLLLSLAIHSIAAAKPPAFCVRVFVADRDGSHSMGSGVLLTPVLVVTNWHVVKDTKSDVPVKVLFPDWSTKAGRVIKVDKLWDIAAIVIPRVQIEPAKLGKKPKIGDQLTVHGYGMGIPASSTGVLGKFQMAGRNTPADIIEITGARVRQGDSGGPILNVAGEYVGTVFGGAPTYIMGTHVERVKIILNSLLKQEDLFDYGLTDKAQ